MNIISFEDIPPLKLLNFHSYYEHAHFWSDAETSDTYCQVLKCVVMDFQNM
jgi:hypothetical protein